MDPKAMLDDLNGQLETLRKELIEMERTFNQKKEQFIRVQGAVEALSLVDGVAPEEGAAEAPAAEAPAPEAPPVTPEVS